MVRNFIFLSLAFVAFGCSSQNPVEFHEVVRAPASVCCKVCTKGKACGNSCISKSKTCHKASGCACNVQ
jgi:hypothetical protein